MSSFAGDETVLAAHKKELKDLTAECAVKVKKAKSAAGKNKAKAKELADQVQGVFDKKIEDIKKRHSEELALLGTANSDGAGA
jgi:predicted outer membrane protein